MSAKAGGAESFSLIELVQNVLVKVYSYLKDVLKISGCGSIRSYEYAMMDILVRLTFEEDLDYDKFKSIVIRVGIENLLPSVETQTTENKKLILIEAFKYAFDELEKEIERSTSRSVPEIFRDVLAEAERGKVKEMDLLRYLMSCRRAESSHQHQIGSAVESKDIMQQDYAAATKHKLSAGTHGTTSEHGESSNFEPLMSIIHDVLYSGAGTMNFMNLAQLLNLVVDPYASIVRKLQVLKRLERHIIGLGVIPSRLQRLRRDEVKVFEALKRVSSGQGSETGLVKVMRFTGSDRYPTYVVGIREYRFGDSASSIDISKTSMNISRKILMGKPFTTRDIIVKEYVSAKSLDIILCLDVSGSMRELSWGVPKIEIAKNAIAKYIQFLANTNDRLSLILFNFKADILWTPHPVRKFWKHMLYILRYVYAGGGTNLASALERSRDVSLKSRATARHVICVTDGRTVNANLCIKEAVRLRRCSVTVSAIAIGENSDDDLLIKMSRIGGGTFIKINNIYELSKALILDKLHA